MVLGVQQGIINEFQNCSRKYVISRLSVFFTTRTDGILDVWDILQEQKRACLSVKVCDEKLRCIRTHDNGKLVAVGNQKGTTYLVEFSDNLSVSNKNDKLLLTAVSIIHDDRIGKKIRCADFSS